MGRRSSSKQRKQPSAKVKKWLNSLLVQLQTTSLNGLSIDDMARLAGRSKSTLYEYFNTKEDVLMAACAQRIELISGRLFDQASGNNDLIEHYEQLVRIFIAGISDITIGFLNDVQKYYPTTWTLIDTFTDRFVEYLIGIYQRGIDSGEFRYIQLDLVRQLDKYFVTEVVTNQELYAPQGISLSQLVEEYLQMRMHGIVRLE